MRNHTVPLNKLDRFGNTFFLICSSLNGYFYGSVWLKMIPVIRFSSEPTPSTPVVRKGKSCLVLR